MVQNQGPLLTKNLRNLKNRRNKSYKLLKIEENSIPINIENYKKLFEEFNEKSLLNGT
jgi:hypothetical protein